jgi:hypothetical protein
LPYIERNFIECRRHFCRRVQVSAIQRTVAQVDSKKGGWRSAASFPWRLLSGSIEAALADQSLLSGHQVRGGLARYLVEQGLPPGCPRVIGHLIDFRDRVQSILL